MDLEVFISYSRKDSQHALALAEKLRAKGITVWMDQESLTPSEQWAGEVVDAIRNCSAFLVLLSSTSVESHNVLKELSLASEKRKRVIPIDLDRNDLPASFEYALAGIQRVAIEDFEAILTSIHKGPPRIKARNLKKSLMVLPFEDLSPTQDNAWFADGLMSELIALLSHIKTLRLIDEKTSRDMRKVNASVIEIAKSYDVRYFLEGSVRKFGDQIKINVHLLDSQEGEHLWTCSHKGVFADIFEIQENVARKVVDGLKLRLTPEEEKKIEDKGTENPEAYQLYIQAKEFSARRTKEGFQHALRLLTEASRSDPDYADALQHKSYILSELYRNYERSKEYLTEAEYLAKKALEIRPDFWSAYSSLSDVYRFQGHYKHAEEAALEPVRREPDNFYSHFCLAFFYSQTNQPTKAIASFETALQLKPDHLTSYWNIVLNCEREKNREKRVYWAAEALPYYEKYLKLRPDDENKRVWYVTLLFFADKRDAAREYLSTIGTLKDGSSLYDIACLLTKLDDHTEALKTLEQSVDKGFSNIELFRTDPDLDPLRISPEFQAIYKRLEIMIAAKENVEHLCL